MAAADKGVPMENSLAFAMALRKHKVPFELHVFEKGPHGLGLGKGSKRHKIAPERRQCQSTRPHGSPAW